MKLSSHRQKDTPGCVYENVMCNDDRRGDRRRGDAMTGDRDGARRADGVRGARQGKKDGESGGSA